MKRKCITGDSTRTNHTQSDPCFKAGIDLQYIIVYIYSAAVFLLFKSQRRLQNNHLQRDATPPTPPTPPTPRAATKRPRPPAVPSVHRRAPRAAATRERSACPAGCAQRHHGRIQRWSSSGPGPESLSGFYVTTSNLVLGAPSSVLAPSSKARSPY